MMTLQPTGCCRNGPLSQVVIPGPADNTGTGFLLADALGRWLACSCHRSGIEAKKAPCNHVQLKKRSGWKLRAGKKHKVEYFSLAPVVCRSAYLAKQRRRGVALRPTHFLRHPQHSGQCG